MDRQDIQITPFFLESPRGPLFCIASSPLHTDFCGAMLYLHPFAEEMHKSRRMAALQSRAFASLGYLVLQIDLTGCGDSAGDFGDATWEAWRADAKLAHDWLRTKTSTPMHLWGLRTGALLAMDIAQQLPAVQRCLLWQPVSNGEQFLTQFLRIKLAGEMLHEGQAQSGTKTLRTQLEAGKSIEVGGYMLSPAMAKSLCSLKLIDFTPACAVEWIEVGAQTDAHISPAGSRIVDSWSANGIAVRTYTVPGDPFWVTQEITECLSLISQSELAMQA